MGKKSKLKKHEYSENEEKIVKKKQKSRNKVFSESDDDEANEDLSLKIVEKAISRANSRNIDNGGEIVVSSETKKKKKKKKKVKKVEKVEDEILLVTPTKEETIVDATDDVEVVNLPESDAVDNNTPDNTVLRRLLRGPRYFDPPDKSWGACFNCGEEGHSAVNCTSARRKRPCFICGSLEHEVKQCQKDCFICKGGGHRAKDCPKKSKRSSLASELCLKCGDVAHTMFSCNNNYSPDDLKEIQCYVCKRFGHLCCTNYFDAFSSEASCYKCGESGHNGQECRGSRGRGETSAGGTPASSCYKCGEEGHFVRDCTNSSKGNKRTRDLSTPTKKHSKDNKASKGYNSTPWDYDNKSHKRFQFDNGSPNWSSKSKRRGGWIPDDDLPPINGWRSPVTPKSRHNGYGSTSGGQGSSSRSPKRWHNYGSGTSSARSYANGHQHRFSASRFGNSSSDGMKRHYDWW